VRAREERGAAREERAAWPKEAKAQQSGARSRELESAAKGKESGMPTERKSAARERGSQPEVRRIFKMLREVWLNIGVEKIDMHKGIVIKVLLDSGTMGMFMDRQMAARHGF